MPNRELDIDVREYSQCGGEYTEMVGSTPRLVVEALSFLLGKYKDDPEAIELIKRLRKG